MSWIGVDYETIAAIKRSENHELRVHVARSAVRTTVCIRAWSRHSGEDRWYAQKNAAVYIGPQGLPSLIRALLKAHESLKQEGDNARIP